MGLHSGKSADHGGDVGVLYRFFGTNRELLYVGITNCPPIRFEEHRKHSAWFPAAVYATLEYYPTYWAAQLREYHAISVERPRYNWKGQPGAKSGTCAKCEVVNGLCYEACLTMTTKEYSNVRWDVEKWRARRRLAARAPTD